MVGAVELLEKLAIFAEEIAARQVVARRYEEGLADCVVTPSVGSDTVSVWAQYTVLSDRRDDLASSLRAAGIPTAIHYPVPLHRQVAYRECPTAPGGLPVSDRLARQAISLPMHAYLAPADQDRVIAAVRTALSRPRLRHPAGIEQPPH